MSEIDEDREPKDAKELLRWSKGAQRNIEFILEQQAKFSADQAKFSADIERINEIQTRTASVVDQLATVTFRRFQSVEGDVNNLDAKMAALVDSHIRLNDAQEKLAGSQKKSDERLDAFINTVERLISERRNGGRGSEDL